MRLQWPRCLLTRRSLLIALVYTEADRARELLAVAVVFLDLATRRIVSLFDRWPEAPSILDGNPNCRHERTRWLEGRSSPSAVGGKTTTSLKYGSGHSAGIAPCRYGRLPMRLSKYNVGAEQEANFP